MVPSAGQIISAIADARCYLLLASANRKIEMQMTFEKQHNSDTRPKNDLISPLYKKDFANQRFAR